MKVSLSGLFSNIKRALPPRERGYYACCLDEVLVHIQAVANGEHTIEEFADHYCIKRRASLPASPSKDGA